MRELFHCLTITLHYVCVQVGHVNKEATSKSTSKISPPSPQLSPLYEVTIEELSRELSRQETILGGDSGTQGYGGSLMMGSMGKVLHRLLPDPGCARNAVFLDAGCALGKPLFLALHHGFSKAFGVELDPNKCVKAITLRERMLAWLLSRGVSLSLEGGNLKVVCSSVAHIPSLEPATHMYAAWQGWSPRDKKALGESFCRSSTTEFVVLVEQNHAPDLTKDRKFGQFMFGDVEQVGDRISVQMAHGMTHLSAYVLRKRTQCIGSTAHSILPGIGELCTSEDERQVLKVTGFLEKCEKQYRACRSIATSAHKDRRGLSIRQVKELKAKAASAARMAREGAIAATARANASTGGARFTALARAREAERRAQLASTLCDKIPATPIASSDDEE